jgi:hypothetical protein
MRASDHSERRVVHLVTGMRLHLATEAGPDRSVAHAGDTDCGLVVDNGVRWCWCDGVGVAGKLPRCRRCFRDDVRQ